MESAAISGAQWVVGKALSPLSDGLVEAWAASSELGPNIEALKMELLYAQAMLDNARGREIRSHALGELLQRLRGLAYGAEDVLDELDYFRIQDELECTFETVDDRGCACNLVRDTRHTAKSAARQLGCTTSCFLAARAAAGDTYEPKESCKCLRRLTSRARTTAHSVGKRLLCSSLLSVGNDQGDDSKHAPRAPKLNFDRVDVSRRMKYIVEQLQPVCAKVSTILDLELLGSAIAKLDKLGSSRSTGSGTSTSRSITTSEALEPTLYGRDREKNSIVEDITKGAYVHRDLTVVPIVGPGGIGKTTLTQHIYNSQEVQEHFEIRVWICVSLDFSVYRLTQEIVRSLPRAEDEKNDKADGEPQNLDQLQKLVEKRLKNRRFLLVLDDIWKHGNEDEWKRFLVPFAKEQGKGNIVLVTTRFHEVAEMVRKGDKSLQVEGLEPKEYWNLFLACVFDDTNKQYKDENLLDIGKKIVKKLKGSPLAVKTVGRLLRDNVNVDHWIRVLESKEWESQTGDNDIMPALKLSYDYLPFYLQQCFSYCALFPEDYRFDREELIRFWIGLDILRPCQRAKRIEDTGLNYLNELVNYGFFKKETEDSGVQYYVMHDLLHDLALKVSSQECLHVASSSARPVEISPCIYHLSISMSPANSEDEMIEENFRKELRKISNRLKSENLHTLMLFGEYDESLLDIFSDLFKDAKSLRVVRLSTMSYTVESILHNFSKLVHLRYLQVESGCYGSDKRLARSLSRFYHLRVLDLRRWHDAPTLLRNMTNLVKLRHFLVPFFNEELHLNISNVGKLHSLQELTTFKVRKESNGFELRELGELEELGGSLAICNLENVQVNEAHEAKLLYKNRLETLRLNWLQDRTNKNPDTEDQVLESLRPHSNLHDLCIDGHGGFTCPTWLSTKLSTKGLEALRLDSVDWKFLPPLGEMWLIGVSGEEYFGCITGPNFHNLKRLELVGLPRFKRWVANEVCPRFFSLIEVLIVRDCPELTELPFSSYTCYPPERDANVTWFPRLRETRIQGCRKLLSLPPIPYSHTLSSVEISCVGRGLKKLSYSNESFISLEIEGNDALHNLDDTVLVFDNLTHLRNLKLEKCPPLAEEHLQMLTSLETLTMHGCSSNLFLPAPQSDVKWQIPVKYLEIVSCGASGKELTQLLSHLPKLSRLTLANCQMITRLGVEAEQQQTTRPILLPSSSVVKLQETHAAGEQQQGEVSPTEEVVVEQEEEEEVGGLLLLPAHLQKLFIRACPELILAAQTRDTGGEGLQPMGSLKTLRIRNCPKFLSAYQTSCSSSCFPFPSSLQELSLAGRMEGMETLAPLSNLTSLETLYLSNLAEDLRCEGLWPLLTRGQISELAVYEIPKFFVGWNPTQELLDEQGQLPLSHSSKPLLLSTDDIAGVLAAPICRLLSSSLTKLIFNRDKEVERFTKEQEEEQEEALPLLTSLQELTVWRCEKLQRLPAGLNKLTNLKRLQIYSCPVIRSLPKDGLPSSLQELDVRHCGNAKLEQRCRRLKGTIPKIMLSYY